MRFPQMFMQGGFYLPAGGGGSGGVTSNLGTHFGNYMQQAGGQRLLLANGNYDGANVPLNLATLNKSFDNSNTYKGWLVLEAQTPGGVTVDLSDPMDGGSWTGGLNLHYNGPANGFTKVTPRILCVGINFKLGAIEPQWMQYLIFYYCDFTWPVSTWNNYYVTKYQNAHAGASPAIGSTFDDATMAGLLNYHPTTVGIDSCSDIEFHFCDFHNIGDDAVFATSSNNLKFVGCRWWDIYHHGINYNRSGGGVLMHSDAIQANGGVTNLYMRNNSVGAHLDIEATGAGSQTIDWDNFWLFGSDHFGITLADHYDGVAPYTTRHTVSGTIKGAMWFGNFQYHGPDDYQDLPNYNTTRDGTYVLNDTVLGNLTLGFNDRLAYCFNTAQPFGGTNSVPGVQFLNNLSVDIGLPAANTAWHGYPSGVTQPLPAGILTPDLSSAPGGAYPNNPTSSNHASNPAVVDRAVGGHGPGNYLAYLIGRGALV